MKLRYEVDGTEHEVEPVRGAGGLSIAVDGRVHTVTGDGAAGGRQVVTVDGRSHRVVVASDGERLFIHAFGRTWAVRPVDPLEAGGAGGAHADHVSAPMPGTVLSVAVSAGDRVAEGDAVLVIESMKLETTIRAPRDAVVEALPLGAGATFEKGALLVRFAAALDGDGG